VEKALGLAEEEMAGFGVSGGEEENNIEAKVLIELIKENLNFWKEGGEEDNEASDSGGEDL
jgi:hypothetical protein